jgi:hypothetical protein
MTGSVALLGLLLSHSIGSWGLPPPVVPRGDLDVLESRLEATLVENRVRRCERPVLRGAPVPGPAAHDLALVATGGAALSACYDFLEEFAAVLFAPPDGRERQTGLVNRFVEVCRPLPPALTRAVSHEDACSPFLPGRRGLPELGRLLRGIAAARQLAALTVLSGDAAAGARRFLDLIRYCQDLVRGGVPLVLVMQTSSLLEEIVVNDLHQLLGRPEVRAADLDAIAAGLDGLLASEPAFPQSVAADTTWLAVEAGLPMLRPPGWEPAGGFSHGRRITAKDRAPDLFPWIPAAREGAVLFSAFMELDRRRRAACPPGATLPACFEGLRTLSSAQAASAGRPGWLRWLLVIGAPDVRAALRRELEARVLAMVDAPFEGYVVRFAGRAFHLAVARLLVEIHREIRRDGRCPGDGDLETERWRRVRADPVFGGLLAVARTGPVSYVITSRHGFGVVERGAALPRFELSVPQCEGR